MGFKRKRAGAAAVSLSILLGLILTPIQISMADGADSPTSVQSETEVVDAALESGYAAEADTGDMLSEEDMLDIPSETEPEADQETSTDQETYAESDPEAGQESAETVEAGEDGEPRITESAVEELCPVDKETEIPACDIALIDTGAGENNNVAFAVSVIGENPEDDNGHGEKMAGCIAEQNPEASILSIKAFDSEGHGTIEAVCLAFEYAIASGVRIINLSASTTDQDNSAELERVINRASEQGIIVVAAAGNDGISIEQGMAGNIQSAYVIGACDSIGRRQPRSNYGDCVDYNVYAESTSEAAAIFSGFVSLYGIEGVWDAVDEKELIFAGEYTQSQVNLIYVSEEDVDDDGNFLVNTVKETAAHISIGDYGSQTDMRSFCGYGDAMNCTPDPEYWTYHDTCGAYGSMDSYKPHAGDIVIYGSQYGTDYHVTSGNPSHQIGTDHIDVCVSDYSSDSDTYSVIGGNTGSNLGVEKQTKYWSAQYKPIGSNQRYIFGIWQCRDGLTKSLMVASVEAALQAYKQNPENFKGMMLAFNRNWCDIFVAYIIESSDDNVGYLSVYKESSPSSAADTYSVAGAIFGVYSSYDKSTGKVSNAVACFGIAKGNRGYLITKTASEGVLRSNTAFYEKHPLLEGWYWKTGSIKLLELPVGTYYIKEIYAPPKESEITDGSYAKNAESYYDVDKTGGPYGNGVYKIEIKSKEEYSFTSTDTFDAPGSIRIYKTSGVSAKCVTDNGEYSLGGAVFGIYSDVKCKKEITRLTTKTNGRTSDYEIDPGTYYVREITPSKGYKLNTEITPVVVKADQLSKVTITEPVESDPINLTIVKVNGSGDKINLAGIEFTVEYTYTKTDGSEARMTLIYATDSSGSLRLSDPSYLIKERSDEPFLHESGTIQFFAGDLKITETKAAPGYILNTDSLVYHIIVGNFDDDGDGVIDDYGKLCIVPEDPSDAATGVINIVNDEIVLSKMSMPESGTSRTFMYIIVTVGICVPASGIILIRKRQRK